MDRTVEHALDSGRVRFSSKSHDQRANQQEGISYVDCIPDNSDDTVHSPVKFWDGGCSTRQVQFYRLKDHSYRHPGINIYFSLHIVLQTQFHSKVQVQWSVFNSWTQDPLVYDWHGNVSFIVHNPANCSLVQFKWGIRLRVDAFSIDNDSSAHPFVPVDGWRHRGLFRLLQSLQGRGRRRSSSQHFLICRKPIRPEGTVRASSNAEVTWRVV